MPSTYEQFDLKVKTSTGALVPIANWPVYVHDATNDADLGEVESDADGVVAAGELDVDVGTTVRFRVENYYGMAMHITQVTT